jgi:hypothetical protein
LENPAKILHGCQVKEMGQTRNFQKNFAAAVFPVHGLIVSEDGREKTYQNAQFSGFTKKNQGKKAPAGRRGQGFVRATGL